MPSDQWFFEPLQKNHGNPFSREILATIQKNAYDFGGVSYLEKMFCRVDVKQPVASNKVRVLVRQRAKT